MSNLMEWNEESERLEIENKLIYLREFLLEKEDWKIPHSYTIIEYFPKGNDTPYTYVPHIYELYNLKIETIEHGTVLFDDAGGMLDEQMYNHTPLPLQAFALDSIVYIGFQDSESRIPISKDNGYIQIFY